jgi:hypothetical protein
VGNCLSPQVIQAREHELARRGDDQHIDGRSGIHLWKTGGILADGSASGRLSGGDCTPFGAEHRQYTAALMPAQRALVTFKAEIEMERNLPPAQRNQ